MFRMGELSYYHMAPVGRQGVLTVSSEDPFGDLDTLIIQYHSFDRNVVTGSTIPVCGGDRCIYDFRSVGWSNGIFYITVVSPDSMMCIYSYKEPEPVSSSVEQDDKNPWASHENSFIMSPQEFDVWRRSLNSSHEMYDLYDSNITTSAIGVGVVFVVFDDRHARVLAVPQLCLFLGSVRTELWSYQCLVQLAELRNQCHVVNTQEVDRLADQQGMYQRS